MSRTKNEPRKEAKTRRKRAAGERAKAPPADDAAAEPKRGNRRLARPAPPDPPSGESSLDALEDPSQLGRATTPLASIPPEPVQRFVKLRRALRRTLEVTAIAAGLLGAVAVGRLTRDYLHTSESFAITTLQVEGEDRLAEADVLEAAGLAVGENVFVRSPEEVRDRLQDHPWIAQATVERRLPDTFELAIEERHAVALLMLDDPAAAESNLYLVGEDATLFKTFEEGDPVDLPIVRGVARERFLRDRAYRSSLLLEVVALMHDYRAAGLWRREPISEIVVRPTDEITLHVGEDGMEVRLGRGPHGDALRRLRRVLDRVEGQEDDARPLYVYLDNVRRPDRVVVRLRETELPAAVEPGDAETVGET